MGEDNSLQGKKFSSARKLIPIWIELEKERKKAEEKPPSLAVEEKIVSQIEDIIKPIIKPRIPTETIEEIKKKCTDIIKNWNKKVSAEQMKKRLPMQYERDQKIMNFRRCLPSDVQLVSPNALEKREDIFKPKVGKEAGVKCDFINTEGNPDVNRVENWAIWAYAWAKNGDSAYHSGLYWRYRIWVPNFDNSTDSSRILKVTPRTVLDGYYKLFAFPLGFQFWSLSSPKASVTLRFYTGKWHHRYTPDGYDSKWVGWRRSEDVVHYEISDGNVHHDIKIPYPGIEVLSPRFFPPPGIGVSPNPINVYSYVDPYDVVDFYVRPMLFVKTKELSFAKLDFSLIDVPFVTVEYI